MGNILDESGSLSPSSVGSASAVQDVYASKAKEARSKPLVGQNRAQVLSSTGWNQNYIFITHN